MLGNNPGSNQNAFSSVPAELLSPVLSAASPGPGLHSQPRLTHSYLILRPWAELMGEQRQKQESRHFRWNYWSPLVQWDKIP